MGSRRLTVRVGSHVVYALMAVTYAWADIGTSKPLIYSAASIVNAATQTANALAPNTIATVYGQNLATEAYGVNPGDLTGGTMPITLRGVSVLVRGIQASMFYVSPGQINF